MIIFGYRSSTIGNFKVNGTTCTYCQQKDTQHIHVSGSYAHVFWIPIFPLGKKITAECGHCKKALSFNEFDNDLKRSYRENQGKAKRPFWHFAGLIVAVIPIFLIFCFTIAVAFSSDPDPRSASVNAAFDLCSPTPIFEGDSLAEELKTYIKQQPTMIPQPATFEYHTEIKENKALILMKIPNLKKLDKSLRGEVIEWIENFAAANPKLSDKELYIAVEGKFTIMLMKTPGFYKNSSIVSESHLYEYFGKAKKQKG